MTCSYGFNDAAYVLGALSPADRAAYEQHLPGCAACREAVANFAVLPGLLRRLGEPEEEQNPVTVDRVPALMESLKRARRSRRRRNATVVLAAFCTALVLGVAGATGMPLAQRPEMVAMQQVSNTGKVTAEAAIKDAPGGTLITMHCAYPADGTHTMPYTFRLVAIGADGTEEQVGSWKAGPGEDITISGTIQFRRESIVRLELRSRNGTPLLTLVLSGD